MQKILYGVAAAILLVIVVGLSIPRYARVETSERIDAPAATVFALLNDFRRTRLWSPLADADPNARFVFSGPVRGRGAAMSWDGPVIGSGTQQIEESLPYELIVITVSPGEPGEATLKYQLESDGGTTVKSVFEHDYGLNIVGRYFGLLWVGIVRRDQENGLSNLKELAESLPRTDFSDIEIEQLAVAAADIALLPTSSSPDPAAMSEALGAAYFEILRFLDEAGLARAGAPISISRQFSGAELRFDAAIPVRGIDDGTLRDKDGVRLGKTYEGSVIRVRHIGAYRGLNQTHRKIASYIAAHGIQRNGDSWESYVGDPSRVAEAELITYVYYPIVAQ